MRSTFRPQRWQNWTSPSDYPSTPVGPRGRGAVVDFGVRRTGSAGGDRIGGSARSLLVRSSSTFFCFLGSSLLAASLTSFGSRVGVALVGIFLLEIVGSHLGLLSLRAAAVGGRLRRAALQFIPPGGLGRSVPRPALSQTGSRRPPPRELLLLLCLLYFVLHQLFFCL